MDGREGALETDPSIASPRSSFQVGMTRSKDAVLEEPNKRVKRVKLRDLMAVMRSEEGIRSSPLPSPQEKGIEEIENSSDEGISQITKTTDLKLFDNPPDIPMNNISLEPDAAVLSLGHAANLEASMVNTDEFEGENNKKISRISSQTKDKVEIDSQTAELLRFGVDLSNPFYPYKKLGQVRATDASECGSTTGSMENNESMRRWNEMKQHGFVSSFKKIAPIPKPHGRQLKKKKNEETKKRSDIGKAELSNKCTKVAAPSGLLSGLNPGIIKHVRNSKQVNSIIEAMLQNEKLEKQELLHRSLEQSRNGNWGDNLGANELKLASTSDQLDLSLNKVFDPYFEAKAHISESDKNYDKFDNVRSNASLYDSEFDDDDVLTWKMQRNSPAQSTGRQQEKIAKAQLRIPVP